MKAKLIFIQIIILVLVGCTPKKPIIVDRNKTQTKIKIKTKTQTKIKKQEEVKLKLKGIYKDSKRVESFIEYMVKNHKFKYNDLVYLFSMVKFQQKALDKMLREDQGRTTKIVN